MKTEVIIVVGGGGEGKVLKFGCTHGVRGIFYQVVMATFNLKFFLPHLATGVLLWKQVFPVIKSIQKWVCLLHVCFAICCSDDHDNWKLFQLAIVDLPVGYWMLSGAVWLGQYFVAMRHVFVLFVRVFVIHDVRKTRGEHSFENVLRSGVFANIYFINYDHNCRLQLSCNVCRLKWTKSNSRLKDQNLLATI